MNNDESKSFHLAESDSSIEEVINRALRIQARSFSAEDKPDLDGVKKLVLQQGKYVHKIVTCWDIRSRKTGEYKFSNLVFATLRRKSTTGWDFQVRRSITIGDKNNTHVIEKLLTFLTSLPRIHSSGDITILDAKDIDVSCFGDILNAISGAGKKADLLSHLLTWINQDQQALAGLQQISSDNPLRSKSLIAALNYGRYHRALEQFCQLVDNNLAESEYQKFLESNYWLFGSEYSELLDKRKLVAGQQLDFPLRRTVDGYIDVIEIKTPLDGRSGFILDKSHNNYYPGGDIFKFSSQVRNYISSLEAERYKLKAVNNIDVSKIRGKLVIGREGSEEEEQARRLLNADARTVEVISFDGIIRIGQRILDIMIAENPGLETATTSSQGFSSQDIGDIPF